jgi:16S rRNA (adenine1518-N6/adenine1519-N6)-dimethyltransferase
MQQKPRRQKTHSHSRIIANRSLGQTFLRDSSVARRIVDSLNLTPGDWVLEIGCGTGALTAYLAGKVQRFFGVELDSALHQQLRSKFSLPGAVFLNLDILTLKVAELAEDFAKREQKIKVVGNLPYYISSPILDWLGRESPCLASATIMVQAEVADRLVAEPGSKAYGVLTLMTQFHFASHRLFHVKPGAFRPAPKVHSTVVRLNPKPLTSLNLSQRERFLGFLKQSFSQRRKTLLNCLKGVVDHRSLEDCLARLGCNPDARAEALSLDQFVTLFKELQAS